MRASRKRRKRRTSEGLTGRGNISSHTEIATIMKSKTFHASQKKRSPYLRVHATGHVSHMGKKGASCDALPTIFCECTAVPLGDRRGQTRKHVRDKLHHDLDGKQDLGRTFVIR